MPVATADDVRQVVAMLVTQAPQSRHEIVLRPRKRDSALRRASKGCNLAFLNPTGGYCMSRDNNGFGCF